MYKNKINKRLDNTQTVYSTLDEERNTKKEVNNDLERISHYDNISIDKKINDIFSSSDYIYKADVKIVTDTGILNKRIVARNRNNLITMDNEYIPISMIRDIYK